MSESAVGEILYEDSQVTVTPTTVTIDNKTLRVSAITAVNVRQGQDAWFLPALLYYAASVVGIGTLSAWAFFVIFLASNSPGWITFATLAPALLGMPATWGLFVWGRSLRRPGLFYLSASVGGIPQNLLSSPTEEALLPVAQALRSAFEASAKASG